MVKERKQDLSEPDEEALEQHVRELMDLSEPEPKVTSGDAPKAKSITVTHHEDKTPDEVTTAIDEALAQVSSSAQSLATAPLLEPAKKSTKVAIIHDEEPAVPTTETTDTAPLVQSSSELDDSVVESLEEAPVADTSPLVSETVGDKMDEYSKQSPLDDTLASPETDKAVSEIVAAESDALLEVQDSSNNVAPKVPKPTKAPKKASLLKLFFTSSAFRWLLAGLIVASLAVCAAVPAIRYKVLNAVGVKSSASVLVIDRSTQQPLKKVAVSLQGKTVQTNEKGEANFNELSLGPTDLIIKKLAFADESQKVTIGWGSNPLEEISLRPVGTQYSFRVVDSISGKPLSEAEAVLGESSAVSDNEGKLKLTLPQTDEQMVKVTISAPGYRTQEIEIDVNVKEETGVMLVVDQGVAFISKRSGKYDLYKTDVDGQNETLLLAGSGNETDGVVLAPSSNNTSVVMIATRSGERGPDGRLKSTATVVKLADNSTKEIAVSSEIKAVDWIGSRFVYVQLNDEVGQDAADRYKLMSYDTVSGDNRQLAVANYFYSVLPAKGKIYYAPSAAQQNGVNVGVFMVHADGSGKQPILDKESWNILRTSYDMLTLSVQQDWYEYVIGGQPTKLSGQPASTSVSRVYTDSPNGEQSMWVDNRDGKGTLVAYDTKNKTEKTLISVAGLQGPIRWLNNDLVVYRVATPAETADYVMSSSGGEPKKITDVTNVLGIDRWTY